MSLTTNLSNAFTRVATEIKTVRTEMDAADGNLTTLSTTNKNSLVEAINEVYAALGTGGAEVLDDLTDVNIQLPNNGDVLWYNDASGEWVNTNLDTTYQASHADLDALSGIGVTGYGADLLTLANQAALMALLGVATATEKGIVELATEAEVSTGTDTTRAITPAGLAAELNTRFAALVDGAPGLLDTLNEIAAALGDDPNFATTITTALGNRVRTDTNAQGLTETQQGNARDNILVYSRAEIGDVTTNFVTIFEAGLV